MEQMIAVLRYFPLDPVTDPPNPIRKADLDSIARETGVAISLDTVSNKGRIVDGDMIREETMNSAIEEVSQKVITVTAGDETAFRSAVRALLKLYRAPRTVFGTWGSSPRGREIVFKLCDEYDGWY
jgi:pyruvate-formate lyase-activating enzyme